MFKLQNIFHSCAIILCLYVQCSRANDAICDGYPTDEITLIRHPNDCSKYIQCYDGQAYEQSCPSGKYWNQSILSCDSAENVDCSDITTTTPGPTIKTTPGTGPTNPPSGDICDGVADGTFLADPNDCASYYECVYGKGIHETCGNGLYWNQSILSCDYANNVDCSN